MGGKIEQKTGLRVHLYKVRPYGNVFGITPLGLIFR